jgi:uncharacterized protein YbaR (Trm112 family)
MIDKELLDILACPACRSGVRFDGDSIECVKCLRRYPIRNGIPVMLIEESRGPGTLNKEGGQR